MDQVNVNVPPQNPTPEAVPAQTPPQPQKEEPKQENNAFADLTIGLPGQTKLLKESLMLFRQKFLLFFTTLFLPLFAIFLTTVFISLLKERHMANFIIAIITIVCTLINILFLSWGHLALLYAIKDNEENISAITAFKRAKHRIKGYWRILFFLGGIVAAGSIAFVIPGILFIVWFSTAIFIYLVEELDGVDALIESQIYVQGYWLSVLGRLIFISLFIFLLYTPLFFLQHFGVSVVYEAVRLIITLIALPIVSIYGFLIYGNLRLLKPNNTTVAEALKANHSNKVKLKLFMPYLIKGALVGLPLVITTLYIFVTRPLLVQGDSMSPSFANNELVITDLRFYISHVPQSGDVVVIKSPVEPEKLLIKRIVGLPSEKVKIKFGDLYINDAVIDEKSYLAEEITTNPGPFLQDEYELPIPQGQYMVLGDNRKDSSDSREWGFIRRSDLVGKVTTCIWGCPKQEKSSK
jgi:signal peptidase I